jgi:hypothetical protein
MDILEAFKERLLKVAVFNFIPTRGSPEAISLRPDGTVSGSDDVQFWQVVYGGPTRTQPMLSLQDEGKHLRAIFQVDRNSGELVGRERDSTGQCLLKPKAGMSQMFKIFGEPNDYYRTQSLALEVKLPSDEVVKGFQYHEPLPPPAHDWDRTKYNLDGMVDRSKLVQSDTAIALVACDRLEYFIRTVQSIGQNPEAKQHPAFLFLDKSFRDSRTEDVEKHCEVARAMLPHIVIVKRPVNFGCGRNIIDARAQLFTNMRYKKVFLFEDDMVVTPTYFKLCFNLLKWGQENYSNIGAVQGWNKCIMSAENKKKRLNEVHATYGNWWGYLMVGEAWEAMEPLIMRYQDLFLGGIYSQRPHRTIIDFFRAMGRLPTPQRGSKSWPMDEESWNSSQRYFNAPPTGQDAVTMHALEKTGYVRLATTVNRGEYIGRHGIHMHPSMFDRDGFNLMTHEVHPEDASLDKFVNRSHGDLVSPTPLNMVSAL